MLLHEFKPSNTTVHHKTGSEGPHWDPYGYEEWTVVRNGKKIVFHHGLGDWVKIDGVMSPSNDADVIKEFEAAVGISIGSLERVYRRIHSPNRCPSCTSKKLKCVCGYHYESMVVCDKCGTIVSG